MIILQVKDGGRVAVNQSMIIEIHECRDWSQFDHPVIPGECSVLLYRQAQPKRVLCDFEELVAIINN